MSHCHRLWAGRPRPLGATWEGTGVNFAIYASHATGVDLCLFDSPYADRESARIPLTMRTGHVWHGFVPHLMPGQLYGFRVDGPWAPDAGHRHNAAKVVLDPYARAIGRRLRWHDTLFGFANAEPDRRDDRDNAAWAPLAAVIDPAFSWGDDRALEVPWSDTVIYELHVRGFTERHPDVPDALRGSYLGLASEPVIDHLKSLGVTAIELLPVHARVDEQHLLQQALSNYWGYSTLSYFAPEKRYATSDAPLDTVREFKTMVRHLHAAGIEVLLDVVYNHTAEGSHLGPTLSMRGIDNAVYYRLEEGRASRYEDVSGCGNTLNLQHPQVLTLVMDSLRYWVSEMHVDGFRFDLATALGRDGQNFDPSAAFFDAVYQDPVLSQVKLIAEPWDLGDRGFQVGRFPLGWSEWNPRFRDAVRRYWRGDPGVLPELATRLAGSSDLFQAAGRQPNASINFVTCHDGFTLQDLVSYSRKHNDGNGEENRDGESNNFSTNLGVEGPTDDPAVGEKRARLVRSHLATLLLSQGVPMICAGDELGRTQAGNNNAYCQDNEISWIDWRPTVARTALVAFTRAVVALRRAHPVLHRREYFRGPGRESDRDLAWFDPQGHAMTADAWSDVNRHALAMRVCTTLSDPQAGDGDPMEEDVMLVLFNAGARLVTFVLPPGGGAPGSWSVVLDTRHSDGGTGGPMRALEPGGRCEVEASCVVLLRFETSRPVATGAPRHRARPKRRASDYRVTPSRPRGEP